MKGQLRDNPLGELIDEISGARLSGVLRAEHERVKAVVYFEDGRVLYAATNLRSHRLSALLRQWGQVQSEKLVAIGADALTDEQMWAALLSAGLVTAEESDALRARQSEEALRPPLLWTDGTWRFNPQAHVSTGTHAPLDVRPLLLEAARRLPIEFVFARLRGENATVSPAADAAASDLRLQVEEAFVLSRVEAPARLADVVTVSGLPDEQARRALYALSLCGLVSREGSRRALSTEAVEKARAAWAAHAPALAAAQAAQASAEEVAEKEEPEAEKEVDPLAGVEAFFAQASGQTHYAVLGVTQRARPEEIKRAYYALARRFHPDRFRRDAGPELFARIESAFGRVARAYEVLKDEKARAQYDSKIGHLGVGSHAAGPTAQSPGGGAGRSESAGASDGGADERAEADYKAGVEALARGDHATAERLLAGAARHAPKQARFRAHYGRALSRDRQKRRQAEAELQAAVSLDPQNPDYRVMLAELYVDVGLRRRAVGELERALSSAPNHAAARRLLRSLTGGG